MVSKIFKGILYLSIICVSITTYGCNDKKDLVKDYKYAIINSNQQKNGKLTAYDENGNKLFKKTVKAKGIDENGESSTSGPQLYNNKHYVGAVSSLVIQDKLLAIDNDTLEIEEIPDCDYTDFLIHNDYIYTLSSEPVIGTTLKKINLKTGQCEKEIELKDLILPHLIPVDDKLILVGIKESDELQHTKILSLSLDTLEVRHEDVISDLRSVNSYEVLNNKLYFIPTVSKNDNDAKKLIIYDLFNNGHEIIDIPVANIRHMKIIEDKLYCINSDINSPNSSMFIMDLKTQKDFQVIELSHSAREAHFSQDELTIASDDTVYIYDLKDMNLKNSFPFETDNLLFGTLIVRDK